MSKIKQISTSALAKKLSISKQQLDELLLAAKYIMKDKEGYILTDLGIQKENSKNGIPYVEWDKSIFNNNAFLSALQEVNGEAGESTQKKIDDSKDSNFREKFIAKHRATDGHMVRSKAEMLIDNWLYMAEIVHAYERKLPIEEEVYCDFYIPTGKVYIEFWGLENDSKYTARKEKKKEIYKKYGFKLIELTDEEVFNLDDVLPKMLLKFGVQTY